MFIALRKMFSIYKLLPCLFIYFKNLPIGLRNVHVLMWTLHCDDLARIVTKVFLCIGGGIGIAVSIINERARGCWPMAVPPSINMMDSAARGRSLTDFFPRWQRSGGPVFAPSMHPHVKGAINKCAPWPPMVFYSEDKSRDKRNKTNWAYSDLNLKII